MAPSEVKSETSLPVKTVAAVDIGSNSIRMALAEVLSDGEVRVLDKLQRAVRLGQDTFRRGRMGGQSMRAAIAILRDYQQLMDFYHVERVRAVATSAIREANNGDTFLDRIFMATGLDVEVIETSEESRLIVSAVREVVKDLSGGNSAKTLIVDVGGGSTLLSLLHKGEIAESYSMRLGSVRLQEMLETTNEPPEEATDILRQLITNEIAVVKSSLPLKKIESFIAVGGDARFAAQRIGKSTGSAALYRITRNKFNKLIQQCEGYQPEELVKRFGIPFEDAETLNPALLIYKLLLEATKAREVIVSQSTMRDGLLLDLAREVTGKEDETLSRGVIHSALAVAEKYHVDLAHAQNVADLADQLFGELEYLHGLGPRYRLIIRIAALLHEVGWYVNSRAHHKHSYYLIANSEIFGLSRSDQLMVAHIARYHRRSCPRPSHLDYMNLPRERRMIVSKLAALLRVADAMDASHTQQVHKFRCERKEEELIIFLGGVADLTLKRRSLAAKKDLFEDIYGLKVRLEEDTLAREKSASIKSEK